MATELKACLDGTHRVRVPEATFRWLEPALEMFGITRLAEITWLDDIGIPVYQAIRPDSWSLCVSQGKGLSADLAKISAAMESIELWHAERVPRGTRLASLGEIEAELDYSIEELTLARPSCINSYLELEWTRAETVAGDRGWVPTELLRLDCRAAECWKLPLFDSSSNGLASGNTLTEALLHGLYELVERDAIGRTVSTDLALVVDLTTVDGPGGALLEQMRRASVEVQVNLLPTPVGLPCFQAKIWSDSVPIVFSGWGCHIDREVAMCRALTEAAQSRLTMIAGTRDDIALADYVRAEQVISGRLREPDLGQHYGAIRRVPYASVDTVRQPDLVDDLRITVSGIKAAFGREPMFVDHTLTEVGIPVVHVVCPGMRFDPRVK